MSEYTNFKQHEILVKHNINDSVFTDLFKDKAYTLELYKSLHPEDGNVTEDDITIITLENVLLNQPYNDLGFIVGDDRLMILVEAQSTWSVNILVRGLVYMVQTIGEHIEKTKQNVYGSKKLSIPAPELFVIYTGDKKEKPDELTLTNEFYGGRKCSIDATVKMIYDGQNGDIVNQYVNFTKVCNSVIKEHGRTQKAIIEIIKICKDKNILRAYLESREKEVMNIMLALFNKELALDRYVEEQKQTAIGIGREQGIGIGREQGIGIGREEGTLFARKEAIRNLMKNMSLSVRDAVKILGIPEKEQAQYFSML